MVIQMFSVTTQSGRACGVCACVCVRQFRLTDFRLYKELQLFPFRPSSFVAVSVHSSSGVIYYFTARGNSKKILLKLRHFHPELTRLFLYATFKFQFVLNNATEGRRSSHLLEQVFSQHDWRASVEQQI